MKRWLIFLAALPQCIFSARYNRLQDARNMQTLAVYQGVHTVTVSCPVCDGWHIAIR